VRSDLRDLLRHEFRWTDPEPAGDYLVSDRSGWWRNPQVLEEIGPALGELFAGSDPTVVVSPEVTGFLLGPLVARALGVGFVEAYKMGAAVARRPIAEPITWADVPADHRGEAQRLGLRSRHLRPGDRVLVVDDWAVTGAQARALYAVVAELGAEPVGTAVIVSECAGGVAAELRIRGLLSGKDL
jgi:adenine phosphoribosyltransferase